jgi:hypothetical protein
MNLILSLPDAVILCSALAAGAAVARRLCPGISNRPSAGLAPALLVGLAVTLVALEAAALWLVQPEDPWNNARLTPAIALHHGFKLYYPLQDGPVLSTVVGPMAFLAYWPIGFFKGSPTTLILLASALNLAVCAGLGLALVRAASVNPLARSLGWLTGAQLVLFYPSLRYSIFCIHSDAPALFLGGLGAGLVIFSRDGLSWRRSLLVALCLTLAVWAKQSLVPIFAAVGVVAGLTHGITAVRRLIAASAIVGGLVSIVFVAWLGYTNLRDNMFAVPAQHPWNQMSLISGEIFNDLNAIGAAAHLKVLVAAALSLARENWLAFAVLSAALISQAREGGTRWRWPRKPWAAWFLIAICMIPTAAIGRIKVGGAVNHESFVMFFFIAALVCWLVQKNDDNHPADFTSLVAVLALLSLVNFPHAWEYRGWRATWDNQSEQAYRYDLHHPGAVYFPWNPLTSLLAEGKLYHFDYGVFDRNLGGAHVGTDHVMRDLPSPRPLIASYVAHHDYILRTYFSDYRPRVPIPDLPGWKIYGPP